MTTLRLLLPQWQGGVNPNYAFGAELLNFIAPKTESSQTVRVEVAKDFDVKQVETNGLVSEPQLRQQIRDTQKALNDYKPDKVIVYGGDCSVDYAPFDYLSGKYGDKLGMIWLDAHSDLVELSHTNHAHETIVTDLLGRKATTLSQELNYPIQPSQLLYVGLPKDEIRPQEYLVDELRIPVITPEILADSSQAVVDWIKEGRFEYIAIHFDLDVLSPADFRANLPGKPYQDLSTFGAAIGRLTLAQAVRFFKDISAEADLVGLGIAEHMPWDALNLRNALSEISIFQD
ncbi:arginase family protein [Fundicoccus culcitae]|uniref:Arginase family protein n=1 Tax=Fundicoccus culcitae TaxID=2969821 RepID=A0ABY5P3K5_9LACT|nr:arginase family protein [Fundicoccus culcitae]UUX33252.1 arginase family protein [Fundicoccus culcitae]